MEQELEHRRLRRAQLPGATYLRIAEVAMHALIMWRTRWCLVLAFGMTVPSVAYAQRLPSSLSPTVPFFGTHRVPVVHMETGGRVKSVGTAVTLSLAATLAPLAAGVVIWSAEQPDPLVGPIVMGGSLLIGPSAGHFYIGKTGGLWLRLGIAAGATAAGLVAGTSEGGLGGLAVFVAVIGIGAGVIFIDGVYDIVRLPTAVRKYNAQLGP